MLYYLLHHHGILPHEYYNRPAREKVLVHALVDYKLEQDKKEERKAKSRNRFGR